MKGSRRKGSNGPLHIEDVINPAPYFTTSFLRSCPEAAALWYQPKNCGYGPDDFGRGSGVRAWFKCPKGADHIFKSEICSMTRSFVTNSKVIGCGYCRGLKISKTNSFARKFPALVKEWMKSKNKFRPEEIPFGSQIKIWWRCKKGHKWLAPVGRRALGIGCRICNLGETIDLRKYPKILKQFDWSKNKGIDPRAVSFGQKLWWKCPKFKSHMWQSGFYKNVSGERCPYCANKRGSKENNLNVSHPHLAKEWHKKRNGDLKPKDFTSGSHRRVWWKCPEGKDHEWSVRIADRVNYGTGCPFCANQRTSKTNTIAALAPHLVKEWHKSKNGKVKPSDERAGSDVKRWWKCSKCKNEWQAEPRRRFKRGSSCPECLVRKVAPDKTLAVLFPKVALEWHSSKNGSVKPGDVHAGTNEKYWFSCSKCGHSWKTQVYVRTGAGCGCPKCRKRG